MGNDPSDGGLHEVPVEGGELHFYRLSLARAILHFFDLNRKPREITSLFPDVFEDFTALNGSLCFGQQFNVHHPNAVGRTSRRTARYHGVQVDVFDALNFYDDIFHCRYQFVDFIRGHIALRLYP